MTWTVLVIAIFGAALARLQRDTAEPVTDPAPDALVELPDDLWADFAASGDIDGRRTTVGGMAPGDAGFVAADAAVRDADGTLWLDAAVVVHPTLTPDRVALRRDVRGFQLQRRAGVDVASGGRPASRTMLPVVELFD